MIAVRHIWSKICLKITHLCIDILGSYYLLINILTKCKIVKPRFLGYAKFQNFLWTLRRQIIKLWLILQLKWSAFIGKLCKIIVLVKLLKNISIFTSWRWISYFLVILFCCCSTLPRIPELSQGVVMWRSPLSVTGSLLTIWTKTILHQYWEQRHFRI